MARCGWQSKSAAVATQSRTASPVGAGPGAVRASRRWRGNAVKGGKVGKLRQGNAVESRFGRPWTGKLRQGNAVKSSHVSAGPVVDGGALATQSG